MRKFVALALAVLMMLAIVPTAFAAKGDITVLTTKYTYYTGVDDAKSDTKSGGTAYVQEKYGNFVNWQVPGNALTGNALSWNKWVQIDATIFVEGYANSTVYIDGFAYTTNANAQFAVTFYVLPVEGGVTINKSLQIWDSTGANSKLIGRANISFIYEDLYTPKGTVTTEGINQANTYAYIDGGAVQVDVVYANLQAKMKSTSATNANYLVPDYYPVQVRMQLLDKAGNKFPAFTRADILNMQDFNDIYIVINQVPNYSAVFYLDENSEVTLEKRFIPGSKNTADAVKEMVLDVYLDAAIAQGATFGDLVNALAPYVRIGATKADFLTLIDNGTLENTLLYGVKEMIVDKQRADITALAANPFYRPVMAIAAGTHANDLDSTVPGSQYYISLAALAANVQTILTTDANYAGVAADQAAASAKAQGLIDALAFQFGTVLDRANGLSDIIAEMNKSMLAATTFTQAAYDTMLDAILYYQVTSKAVVADVAAVRNRNYDYLNDNANMFNSKLDKLNFRLTDPTTGAVSTQEVTIQYNSVSRITSKGLTTLEGSSITVAKGETVNVTVNAKQNGVPVTGLPIKFTSNDSNIATATSPNTQDVNTNTTTITGVNVGTTFVKAYIDSSNDGAETYIMVNVVDPTPDPVPTPETTDYVCKVRKLWVREGAGTSYSKVGYYSRNDVAKVYEVVNGWAKVDYNGTVAYSSTGNGKYLAPK